MAFLQVTCMPAVCKLHQHGFAHIPRPRRYSWQPVAPEGGRLGGCDLAGPAQRKKHGLHDVGRGRFKTKYEPETWYILRDTKMSKPRLGNARWLQVLQDSIAPLLLEKAPGARLEKRQKFFETACNGGGTINRLEPTTQVLESSKKARASCSLAHRCLPPGIWSASRTAIADQRGCCLQMTALLH